ncbi:MAG: DUF4419 domain-containing protein [Alphaproteobacteria bacterium]|nr:DUF4419 domain-containing protein [Alphaproteobacteria bacterium]MCB9791482.1 DUF4419 domain-containing protein [Alphaproteobacteria bacterium]
MAITFAVSDVERATERLRERPFAEVVAERAGGPLEAWPPDAPALLDASGLHPLIEAMLIAFHEHRPLVLSPDAIWLTLLQGFAQHVGLHGERLRVLFVEHTGKLTLKVRRDDFVMGNPGNDWPGAVEELVAQMRAHVGEFVDEVVADFSTSDLAARTASHVVLMDTMQHYFSYEFETLCGIPEITLLGTPEDWTRIRERLDALAYYDLEWWTDAVRPVLEAFERAAGGDVDPEWWRSLFKWKDKSGGPYVTGHVLKLFPYLMDLPRGGGGAMQPYQNPHLRERQPRGVTTEAFPTGPGRAPCVWDHMGTRIPLELLGGLMGVRQHPDTLALEPVVSWALRRADLRAEDAPRRSGALPLREALGAGSLPWADLEPALRHVEAHHGRAPFWPQLHGPRGHADMIREALGSALRGLRRRADGQLVVPDPSALLDALAPELHPGAAPGFFAFERAVEDRRFPEAQVLKGQLVGPWTLASALQRPELLGPLTAFTCARARWQLRRLARFGLPVVLVVDAPSLASAPPEWRDRAVEAVTQVLRDIDEHGGISGLHCCAALDLGLLPALAPRLFHFDVLCYGPILKAGLRAALAHPGFKAWWDGGGVPVAGVIPTTGALPHPKLAREAVEDLLGDKPYMLSTACGLSGVSPEQAVTRTQALTSLAELAALPRLLL